jgi:hypothetical protein
VFVKEEVMINRQDTYCDTTQGGRVISEACCDACKLVPDISCDWDNE